MSATIQLDSVLDVLVDAGKIYSDRLADISPLLAFR